MVELGLLSVILVMLRVRVWGDVGRLIAKRGHSRNN